MIGIYKLTNPKGKVYIGQSYDINKRMRYYKTNACKQQRKLYFSLVKYGFQNHSIEILETIDLPEKELLDKIEIKYIRKYLYEGFEMLNLSYTGISGGLHSEESKSLIRIARAKQSPPTLGMIIKPKMHTCKLPPKKRDWWVGKKHKESSKELQRQKKLNCTKHNRFKLVLNNRTGIFYDSLTEAAFSVNKTMKTMSNQMRGKAKNKTGLIYV